MIYNAMAATCIGVHFGMTFDEIDKGIRKLKQLVAETIFLQQME